eukprot:3975804-Pleurochrysis_carterae.AAC.9
MAPQPHVGVWSGPSGRDQAAAAAVSTWREDLSRRTERRTALKELFQRHHAHILHMSDRQTCHTYYLHFYVTSFQSTQSPEYFLVLLNCLFTAKFYDITAEFYDNRCVWAAARLKERRAGISY